jgi:hypothetical protein
MITALSIHDKPTIQIQYLGTVCEWITLRIILRIQMGC